MKHFKLIVILLTQLTFGNLFAQLSINISSIVCLGTLSNVSINTGTLSASQYTWSASPAGPVFSTPSASNTNITFALPITYTISVDVLTGSGLLTSSTSITILSSFGNTVLATTANSLCPGYTATLTGFGALSYSWTSPTNSFTGTIVQQSISVGSGIYLCARWHGANCLDTLPPFTIYGINPAIALPITIAVSQPTTCIASNNPKFSMPVHLKASGAGTYTWFPLLPPSVNPPPNNQIDVMPVSSTCYTVIGASAVCSNSAVYCVTVVPQFSISILPSLVTMCEGDSITLQVGSVGSLASGPSSSWTYSWTESSTSAISMSSYFTPTVTIFPQNSASYTLQLRDSQECISSPEVTTVTVNKCTGITEVREEAQFRIFPNPITSQIKIQTTHSGNTSVFLSNILGTKILETTLEMNGQLEFLINVPLIPPGVYYLTLLTSDNEVLIQKIIKQ